MTDLFISASAALLMVIAVLRTTPPIPIPIQADIVATCSPATTDATADLEMPMRPGDRAEPAVSVSGPDGLSDLPERLGLPPRLFYTIAVVSGAEAPLSAACLQWAQDKLVRAYNKDLESLTDRGTARPVYAVVPGNPPSAPKTP